jgi:hypothetical protein
MIVLINDAHNLDVISNKNVAGEMYVEASTDMAHHILPIGASPLFAGSGVSFLLTVIIHVHSFNGGVRNDF